MKPGYLRKTLDTTLNMMASLVTDDIFKKFTKWSLTQSELGYQQDTDEVDILDAYEFNEKV